MWRHPAVLLWGTTLLATQDCVADSTHRPHRKPRQNLHIRDATTTTAGDEDTKRIHLANMTCHWMPQALNHFALPRSNNSSIYMQRYCVYDRFVTNWETAPIFFYTGNEAPLEEYINNTGLMWELAPQLGAQVVFAEHRYEGVSLPDPSIPNCMAYSSSIQALADFASLLEQRFFLSNYTMYRRPVIAFGGSYGGMLAAWMRIKYPNVIQGAIAGSAPVAGFPYNDAAIDSATKVIAKGLKQPYPPTDVLNSTKNHCFDNLLASWSLIAVLERSADGRALLTESFRLCDPLVEGDSILEWAQSPWFDLAEGSFPYPSSYVIFALTKATVKLPAWPLQAACWTHSSLYRDFGISFQGNVSDVRYSILLDGEPIISVDWDVANLVTPSLDESKIAPLLENVRDAIAIWFNVTKDVGCFQPNAAPNVARVITADNDNDAAGQCREKMAEGSWPSLCCNEEMNLVITAASGLGSDFVWPPSHRRGTQTYRDIADQSGWTCDDPNGYFGYPQDAMDVWSTSYESYYGNTCLNAVSSNIVYSNGLLDPWSAAGVYDPTQSEKIMEGLTVQRINNASTIALIMDYGGHHTDLMYSDKADPPSISKAREIETEMIRGWIESFWTSTNRPAASSPLDYPSSAQ